MFNKNKITFFVYFQNKFIYIQIMENISTLLKRFLHKKIDQNEPFIYWRGSDSKNNFKSNLRVNYDRLKYYIKNPIIYNSNKDGFRSNFEFIQNKKLNVDIYLGCSHTLGIGHLWENTWPHHVSDFTNNEIVNLGMGGTGVEVSFINLAKYINYFDVKNVFHYQPIYARYSYPHRDRISNTLIQNLETHKTPSGYIPWTREHVENELINDDYIFYNHYKNIMSIEGLCNQNNVPYYHIYTMPPKSLRNSDTLDARDLLHYTTTQMEEISKNFTDKIKTSPNGYNEVIDKLNNTELKLL